jgi:hypothetical protein
MRFEWMGRDVTAEIEKLRGKGLVAAGIHATRRLKEVLSVPAPRRIAVAGVRAKWVPPGTRYYVATTRATPGAPPRKLSGQLRRSVTYEVSPGKTFVRVGTNVVYARKLENGGHPWLLKTMIAIGPELAAILGKEVRF